MYVISVEMKRFLTLVSALVCSGAVLMAQEVDPTKDTLVVVVKHEAGDSFFETVGKPFKKGYKAVENAFVEPFTDTRIRKTMILTVCQSL